MAKPLRTPPRQRKAKTRAKSTAARRARKPEWADWPFERLLDVRFKDLRVDLEGTWVQELIDRVKGELQERGIRITPHFWLSVEWFSPQGIPGVAVPFYLAHPRLAQLELKQMRTVEGGTRSECLKILRHEVGHAVQQGFELHRFKRWQTAFGRSSEPYPDYYRPNPASRKHVLHLDRWYGQSHPDEDFAETFATWLQPGSRWRQRYAGWPALAKLECVDELMAEVAGRRPSVRSRERVDPLSQLDQTLREHYEQQRERFATDRPWPLDADLLKLFPHRRGHRNAPTAASFLRRRRDEIRALVAPWVGRHEAALDQVFKDMMERCRQLGLRAVGPERRLEREFAVVLGIRAMQAVYRPRDWHAI